MSREGRARAEARVGSESLQQLGDDDGEDGKIFFLLQGKVESRHLASIDAVEESARVFESTTIIDHGAG